MALFYCLFFCIYFMNKEIVEFLRNLIPKMASHHVDLSALKKVQQLQYQIDLHGLDRLRTPGDKHNLVLYHWVFYQSIDDKLRVVYSKILRRLKEV
mmetsp:Transcript_41392/g.63096  ORF Transcript_41392/g.63096 Transcript_41392/m.63096 type:complete len:96 (-) Transcript_41392:710-997(-)